MKRFFIFTLLFPPLALAVFTAPDGFKNLLSWLVYAYPLAMIPALSVTRIDWNLSAKTTRLPLKPTTLAGALITGSVAFFLGGGFTEFFPALLTLLVGAVPAAVCSWLSTERAA